jgi:aminoglycoside N3'-acetyltransferase
MFTTTKENLVYHLRNDLNLKKDDLVFMHSGLVELGRLEKGLETITEAFSEVLSEGLLVIPSFTYSWCHGTAYDPNVTECPNEVGTYSKNAWKSGQFARSGNPNFAVAALKNNKNQGLIKRMFDNGRSCFGENSVFDLMYRFTAERGGYILLLGGAHNDFVFRCAFIHYVEEKVKVPSRYLKKFYNPDQSGEYVEQLCRYMSREEYESVNGSLETDYRFPIVSDYTRLGEDLIKSSFFVRKPFGYGASRMVSLRTFCDFLKEKLTVNADYCVKGMNHGCDCDTQQMLELRQ